MEGNDFRDNAVGVYLWGDGGTADGVDLGGGSFGSQGRNNFSTFTAAGTGNGSFAVTMHNTTADDQVFAYGSGSQQQELEMAFTDDIHADL